MYPIFKTITGCPSPPFLRNAEVRLEGMQDSAKTYRRGSRAIYSCGEGFRLSPPTSKIRTCKDGYWTGPQGRCGEYVSFLHVGVHTLFLKLYFAE